MEESKLKRDIEAIKSHGYNVYKVIDGADNLRDIVEERSNIGEAGDLDYLLIKMYEDLEGEGNFYLCEKRYEESPNKSEI